LKKEAMHNFVCRKIELLDANTPHSNGMCAKMRRAIGKHPGAVPDIWGVTLDGLPTEARSNDGNPHPAELAIHTALTLYALHRQGKDTSMNQRGQPFGRAVAALVTEDNMTAIKRRFDAVATSSEVSELAHHARGMIQLLKASGVPLDYSAFAYDLYRFHQEADRVRLRWGEDFYSKQDKSADKEAK
jgi:CRISPR system Cascade subunit CasB